MELNLKQYRTIKIIIVFGLAFFVSQSIVFRNFFAPVVLLAISSLVLLYLRKKVKGILADERDYAMVGKSAFLAIQIYSWIAVVCMFLFYAMSDLNPYYEAIAMTLAFSTCILMLLNSVIFRYYDKFKFSDKRFIYSVAVLILFVVMAVFAIRMFSGEDNWICDKGQWVKHGNPSFSAPNRVCK